jgi:hypothetical protein
MAKLSFIFILTTTTPRINLSCCIQGDTMKISTSNICDCFTVKIFEIKAMNTFTFTTSFIPKTATPREECSLLS